VAPYSEVPCTTPGCFNLRFASDPCCRTCKERDDPPPRSRRCPECGGPVTAVQLVTDGGCPDCVRVAQWWRR